MTPQSAIHVLEGLLSLAPAGAFLDYDVVFDTESAGGAGIDALNRLWVIHGGTFEQVRQAVAAAGGVVGTQLPTSDLTKRIIAAREVTPSIANVTLGKVDHVLDGVANMIDVLKSGQARPIAVTPITAVAATPRLATPKQFAIAGATVGVVLLGVIGAVLLTR
jgi:hypothetical protein